MDSPKLSDICNNNNKNMPTEDTYRIFNEFIFSSDIKLIGKLLHRFDFFNKTKHLPGDIVEIGVYKGSGIATFSKFLEIYCPNSNKKIIGFDIFDAKMTETILNKDASIDKETMKIVLQKVAQTDLTIENVNSRLENMKLNKKYILIKGDIEDTLPIFVTDNPGFRASLIYIDVDIERPTYIALKYLWDRLLPGGIILFDEFEYHKFSESCGVEKFLQEFDIKFDIRSTNWIAPTAYICKK